MRSKVYIILNEMINLNNIIYYCKLGRNNDVVCVDGFKGEPLVVY